MRRGGRVIENYQIGDIVKLHIPAPDRQRLGRRLLPCKVMEVLDGGWYKLGCSEGILDTHYQAADLESVRAEYSELADIPQMTISLTTAIRLQGINESAHTDSNNSCNCRANCSTRRCPCKRANSTCSSNCHSNNDICTNH